MDNKYKSEIVNRMLGRSETNLYFVQDFLRDHSASDGAYLRSISILLSYSFELILKAKVVMSNEYKDKIDLEKSLKNLNHDLIKISDKLGGDGLGSLGIKSISMNKMNFIDYTAITDLGNKILVENFTDIRYDFINDSLRSLPMDHEFNEWLSSTFYVLSRAKSSLGSSVAK